MGGCETRRLGGCGRSVAVAGGAAAGRRVLTSSMSTSRTYTSQAAPARPFVCPRSLPYISVCTPRHLSLSVTRSPLLCYIHGPDPGLHHCVYNATFGYNIATGKHCSVRPARQSDKHPVDSNAGSGPPPLNRSTFRPVVGQLSEVVPFLLLQLRCGTACQAMLHQPRRCRCSKTG